MGAIKPMLVAIPLILGVGIVDGLRSDRWRESGELQIRTARLAGLPLSLGEWQGQERQLDARTIAAAQLTGYISRHYVHRKTGKAVSVLLVCGRPGPVCVHTPDTCYPGAGYFMSGDPERKSLSGKDWQAEMMTATFRREEAVSPDPIRVYWGWSATGSWRAPSSPRLTFAPNRALYKLYVVQPLVKISEPVSDKSPAQEFMNLLMPELNRQLFGE